MCNFHELDDIPYFQDDNFGEPVLPSDCEAVWDFVLRLLNIGGGPPMIRIEVQYLTEAHTSLSVFKYFHFIRTALARSPPS